MDFKEKETIKKLIIYSSLAFTSGKTRSGILPNGKRKVFYGIKDLMNPWRFLIKAVWYRDWLSIKSYFKSYENK